MLRVREVSDKAELISQAAWDVADVLSEIQNSGGGVHGDGIPRLVLTGGGAGIGVLSELRRLSEVTSLDAEPDAEQPPAVDWSRVHIFFGDERNLPIDDEESNEGQARRALLDPVDVPAANVHGYAVPADDADAAAREYEQQLAENAPSGFDLHLLGMGPEGHINSLFPHSAAVREDERLAIGVTDSPKPPAERISLTLPAIARARRAWLLVAGSEKAEAASHVQDGSSAAHWPAAGVPAVTDAVLYLAADAAGR